MIEHFLSILSDLSYEILKKTIYIQKQEKKKGRYPGRKEEISNETWKTNRVSFSKNRGCCCQKGEERAP